MKSRPALPALALGALLAATLHTTAWSADQGQTLQGLPYRMGGIGDAERASMRAERMGYSLWVQVASARGAFLADARVQIIPAGSGPVLDAQITGPWLFANLKPGIYNVLVSYGGKSESRQAAVRAKAHDEMVFYFDEPDSAAAPPGSAAAPSAVPAPSSGPR